MSQPFSITLHYMDWSKDDSSIITRLKELKRLFSADSIKVDCSWRFIEVQDGVYDFAWPERICKLCDAAALQVWFILNNAWGMPDWIIKRAGIEAFAWNSQNLTGRNGRSADSDIGQYPAPVIPAYFNPWVTKRISLWQAALVNYLETRYARVVAGYIAEGEIYLNPDNDLQVGFDYNPHTITLFRQWLHDNPNSYYYGCGSPNDASRSARFSLNSAWHTVYASWNDVNPPRSASSASIMWRDWALFLRWYVSWSYRQVTQSLRKLTRKPITLLLNSFTGWPMPDDHVWAAHRTHVNAWSVYHQVAPYVDYLGLTAYQYDCDWEIDRTAAWQCSMSYIDGCAYWFRKSAWIVEGGSIMRTRSLADLIWQLFSSRIHGHRGCVLGYLDMASGQNTNYSWNGAVAFESVDRLSKYYADQKQMKCPDASIAVVYNSLSELLYPGDGTEARAVRGCVRWLRSVGANCHVVDSTAVEMNLVNLRHYKLIIMPCIHSLSNKLKFKLQQANVPVYSDQHHDLVDEWLRPTKQVRLSGVIDSVSLGQEQKLLEDQGEQPDRQTDWLPSISRYTPMRSDAQMVVVDASARYAFNRDADKSHVFRGHIIPAGCEYPVTTPVMRDTAPANAALKTDTLPIRRMSDGYTGPSRIDCQIKPEHMLVEVSAYDGPPGFWLASAFWNVGQGLLTAVSQIAVVYTIETQPSSDHMPEVSLRLICTGNGREYKVALPITAQSNELIYSLNRSGLAYDDRKAEIDRVAVCVEGTNWKRIGITLNSIRLKS